MLQQYYRSSPHWPALKEALNPVLDLFATSDKTSDVAEASTGVLLDLLGWKGQILRSSQLTARSERSQRLADLAQTTGAHGYLCGTGGMKYLKAECFDAFGICVIPFRIPASGIWGSARESTALTTLMQGGFGQVAYELLTVAAPHRAVTRWGDSDRAPCSAAPAGSISGRPDLYAKDML